MKVDLDVKRKARPTKRERLMELLAAAGYPVTIIHGAQGYYRISKEYDDTTVCWEASSGWTRLVSYDTMTDCVRYGVDFYNEDGLLWVHAKKPDKEAKS